MTDYDYSPDAVQQYLATQNRVSNWIDHTNQHTPGNPFAPSTCPSPTKSDSRSSKTHASKSKSKSRSRLGSDETNHLRGQARLSSSTLIPGSFPSSPRLPSPPHTESSARLSRSASRTHSTTTTTQPSSLTATSRHSRELSNPYRIVGSHADRPTVIPQLDKKDYFVNLRRGRSGVTLLPPPGKRMEVWVSLSLLLLLFLSWWAASDR